MNKFKELQKDFSFPECEKSIISFWEENKVFEKSLEINKDAETFVFYEGPPTANGKPGIHHVISRSIKDLVCRYNTMRGYHVPRKAGWDTHGLPVETEVEKRLGFAHKKEIETYGVAKFNQLCRDSVFTYLKDWEELTRRMGYWLDYQNPYITFDNGYIETIWWILKQFWQKDLLYKDYKIVPYSAKAGTALSSHEVALGYKEVRDPSVFVRMKSLDDENTSYLVWTTTPWTLLSNVVLAVGADYDYVKVKYEEEYLILAEALVAKVVGEDAEIVERYKGSELENRPYRRIYDYVPIPEGTKTHYVTNADFVTLEDGTGIVHVAPAFGADDFELSKKYNLPLLKPVDEAGQFTDEVEPWKGMFVKDADKGIIKDMKERGVLFKAEEYLHNYPFCWRTGVPLIYFARESWYIRTSQFKQQLIDNNNAVNWYPPEVGKGRFGDWLENNVDWALSRDRYWGTPLPIWICDECDTQHAIGSMEELREMGIDVPENLDLHKPMVDEIKIKCPSCGSAMTRVPQVIDVWFDSGSMPFSQIHYPFENKENLERHFPCDFICEAIDQTRGWFYSLLAISTMLTGKSPYKNVLVNNLILDKQGQKMSKSVGNIVNPFVVMDKYGADALRWYFLSSSQPWLPKRFDEEGVAEAVRKFFDTLKNVYSFFTLYANIDNFNPATDIPAKPSEDELDRWILSRLNSTIKGAEEDFGHYDLTRLVRRIQSFVIDDLSNWYVRRNRRRFWQSGESQDKLHAFSTLWKVLVTVSKIMAPIAPFYSEELYTSLVGEFFPDEPVSVHLSRYPEVDESLIDESLEHKMEDAVQLVTLGRAARNRSQIKVRQPLGLMLITTDRKLANDEFAAITEIIGEEINVKDIRWVDDAFDYVSLTAKPDFKVAGPKFGPMVKQVAQALEKVDQQRIVDLQRNGSITVDVNGDSYEVTREDVDIRSHDREGYVAELEGGYAVVLATELSEELIAEGFARELVNKIQNMRKSAGFEVMDRVRVVVDSSSEVSSAIDSFGDYIRKETLCDSLLTKVDGNDSYSHSQEWDINGQPATISLSKL